MFSPEGYCIWKWILVHLSNILDARIAKGVCIGQTAGAILSKCVVVWAQKTHGHQRFRVNRTSSDVTVARVVAFNPNEVEMTRITGLDANDHQRGAPQRLVKLVCGCGYLGERVARKWVESGNDVWVTTRSATRADELSRAGFHPLVVDVTHPFTLPVDLSDLDTVLWAVGFDRSSHQSIEDVYVEGLRNVLAALPSKVNRFIFISSTGVYGQSNGVWVDEQARCLPTRPGGRAYVIAEDLLAKHETGKRRVILRLAGIYGPQRIPKLAAVRAGELIESPQNGFLNLIHIDDAVQVVLAAERYAMPPALFVVADGRPVLRGDFYCELARLLKAPPPKFAEPPAGSSTANRASTDKRVCNEFMKTALGVSLRYPSFREGLAAIVAEL